MDGIIKRLTLLFAILLSFSLIGCGSTTSETQNEQETLTVADSAQNETVKELDKIVQDNAELKTSNQKVNRTENTQAEPNSDSSNLSKETKSKTPKMQDSEKDVLTSKNDQSNIGTISSNKTATVNKSNKEETSSSPNENKQNEASNATKNEQTTSKQSEPGDTVSITIIGPRDFGVILEKTKISISKGDTILDILLKATKQENIFVEYSGTGAMAYIEGIDNVYEFDYGPKSGWNFKQNGTTVSKSSGIVEVKKNDVIEWVYSEGNE